MPDQMHDGNEQGNHKHRKNEKMKRRIEAGVIGEILRNFLSHCTLLDVCS
jgi:hypothetical protein